MNKNPLFDPAAPCLPFTDTFGQTVIYTGLNKFETLTAQFVAAMINTSTIAALTESKRREIVGQSMNLAFEVLASCQNAKQQEDERENTPTLTIAKK